MLLILTHHPPPDCTDIVRRVVLTTPVSSIPSCLFVFEHHEERKEREHRGLALVRPLLVLKLKVVNLSRRLRPRLHETGHMSNRNENGNCQHVHMRPVRKYKSFELFPLPAIVVFLQGFVEHALFRSRKRS